MSNEARTDVEWSRVEQLFPDLLELPPAQRKRFLDRHCAKDLALRAELESLVAAADTDSLLDTAPQLSTGPEPVSVSDYTPGERIGAWQTLRLLGRGGMGEVYLAQRADGGFEQRAAIKLLRPDAAQHLQRFETERSIVAALDHPNIAHLLDGGLTHAGRPYMVMEYIEGQNLRAYCAQLRLGLDARLQIFEQIGRAVAYAHAHLVIHRDLKPGNILVTADAQAKLLDFGVAKLLDPVGLGGEATLTAPFTPNHAAPEQLQGLPATTAVDVYALGVLLYELLSGRPPWSFTTIPVASAVQRLLREDPDPASRAAAENPDPPVPPRALAGDLDAIIGKCLRKTPQHRYATVEALLDDLRRWRVREPVSARGDALGYIARRWFARHRLAVGAGALVLAALIAGLGVALWQAQEARIEARRADAEVRKAGAVKDFLIDIFQHNSAGVRGTSVGRNTTAEQLLARGAQRIRDRLDEVPEVRAELLGTIGGLYRDLLLDKRAVELLREQVQLLRRTATGAQGRDALTVALVNLGAALSAGALYGESDRVIHEALALMDARGETDSAGRADALTSLGENAYWLRPSIDLSAEKYFSAALTIAEQRHPQHPLRLRMLVGLARAAEQRDDLAQAERRLREALSYGQAAKAVWPLSELALAHRLLGCILREQQRFNEAKTELRTALALNQEADGPDSPSAALAQLDLAMALADSGARAEAVQRLHQTLAILASDAGAENSDIARSVALELGRVLYQHGLFEAAAHQLEPLVAQHAAVEGLLHPTLTRLARVRLAQGRPEDARRLLDAARPVVLRDRGEHSLSFARLLTIEAELALEQHDAPLAFELLKRAHASWSEPDPNQLHVQDLSVAWNTARALLMQGEAAAASASMHALLTQIRAHPQAAALIDEEAQTRYWLGAALLTQSRAAEAQGHLQRAVQLRKQLDDPMSPWLAQAQLEWASSLRALGERASAQRLEAQAHTVLARHPQLARSLRARHKPSAGVRVVQTHVLG